MNKQTVQQQSQWCGGSSFPAMPARAKCNPSRKTELNIFPLHVRNTSSKCSPDLLWSLCGWPGAGSRVQVQELGQPLWQRAPPPLWESSRGSRTDPQWDQGRYCSYSWDLQSIQTHNQLISGHIAVNICSPLHLCVGLEYNTCKYIYDCVTQTCATVTGSALHFPAGFACTEQQSSISWCSQCLCELNSVCAVSMNKLYLSVCLTSAWK